MFNSDSNQKWSYHSVRLTLAMIYIVFGGLKFFSGSSPAEQLAGQTIHLLTLESLTPELSLLILAIAEVLLGIAFLINIKPRVVFFIFLAHMAGTFTPLFLLPELMFQSEPFGLTLAAQYILKNLVFVTAVSTVYINAIFGDQFALWFKSFNSYFFPTAEPALDGVGMQPSAMQQSMDPPGVPFDISAES